MASSRALMISLKLPNRVQPEVHPLPGKLGQYTNKLHYMRTHLLDELPRKAFALDFMQPVDTEALQVPTYYTIIQCPMDVGTVMKRVQNNYYQGVEGLIADFKLLFHNCYKFNAPEDMVHRNGKKLEQFFNKILCKLPEGEELPCHIDPKALPSPQGHERASVVAERQCRSELKKLQACNDHLEPETRDFFKEIWTGVSKKLNKHQFKTVPDFQLHISSSFECSRLALRRIFESSYQQSFASICPQPHGKQISELICAVRRVENESLPFIVPQCSWEQSLLRGLDASAQRLRQQLHQLKLDYMQKQALERQQLSRQEQLRYQSQQKERSNRQQDAARACYTEQDEFVSDTERRALQEQFLILPLSSKTEIMRIIAQSEDINEESCELHWFDIKNFTNHTLNIMKRVMRPHTKLNLRNMKPEEKEDLQRSLEMRLSSINQALNGNRRKYTHQQLRLRTKAPPRKKARYAIGTKDDARLKQSDCQRSQQQQQQQQQHLGGKSQPSSSDSSDSDSNSDSSSGSGSNKSSNSCSSSSSGSDSDSSSSSSSSPNDETRHSAEDYELNMQHEYM